MSPGHRLDEKAFLRECLGVGRQWLLQRRLTSAESVSLELFRTGLALARHRGLEGPGGLELQRARAGFLAELEGTLATLSAEHVGEARPHQLFTVSGQHDYSG